MIRILVIDDQENSVQDAIETLERNIQECHICLVGFEDGIERVRSLNPSLVVLDIWKGDPQNCENGGSEIMDLLWDQQFCPVIVYSANPGVFEEYKDHPFVYTVQKGSGSDLRVLKAIQDLDPHIKALKQAEDVIGKAFSSAMKDVAPYAFENTANVEKRFDIIIRAGRRRVAALMDAPLHEETNLATWEQYLCPPVSGSPQLGDILMLEGGQSDDPASFRIILTPSCDMVSIDGRTPKVDNVLVAKCHSIEVGLSRLSMSGISVKKLSSHAILSQGFYQALIPFPCLQGKIPPMVADLRDLELVPVGKISSSGTTELHIIASIDSPFRETVSWAYLQISCRPGLPERDLVTWSQEIKDAISNKRGDINE